MRATNGARGTNSTGVDVGSSWSILTVWLHLFPKSLMCVSPNLDPERTKFLFFYETIVEALSFYLTTRVEAIN